MDMPSFLFYIMTFVILAAASSVVLLRNPIHSALALAITMITLGFMYFGLEAYFIAGVQLIVYAGAVMVMFVMVLMLFDLKKEVGQVTKGTIGALMKVLCGMALSGIITWAIRYSSISTELKKPLQNPAEQMAGVKILAVQLFTKYVFAFELLGALLLIIAVGVVAVARSRGGTHARD
ncbi:MAG: hypothetical protein A2Z20_01690 [Bdellovibrionales bacterium RBG_16_40_8]|nr:MAG: hypothetical protein A2Z20_01690 [Bdellovibrionales bacterium RBG_16_40_8]